MLKYFSLNTDTTDEIKYRQSFAQEILKGPLLDFGVVDV